MAGWLYCSDGISPLFKEQMQRSRMFFGEWDVTIHEPPNRHAHSRRETIIYWQLFIVSHQKISFDMDTLIHPYIYIYIYIGVCVCMCVNVCTYVCVCVCVCLPIYRNFRYFVKKLIICLFIYVDLKIVYTAIILQYFEQILNNIK